MTAPIGTGPLLPRIGCTAGAAVLVLTAGQEPPLMATLRDGLKQRGAAEHHVSSSVTNVLNESS